MYCPRCGQQQISDEMRFCSRCGLLISGLMEWITAGGVPAQRLEEKQVSLLSPRRKGMRRGARLMSLSGVLLPISLVLGLVTDEAAQLVIPIFIFFVGLVLMLYARFFAESSPPIKSRQTTSLGAPSTHSALPQASIGLNDVGRQQVRTAELAQPASVTEHTTKLLDTD